MPGIGSAAAIPFRGAADVPFFDLPLVSSITAGLGSFQSFTRGDADATITTNEGQVKQVTADEVRFYGARRVYNKVIYSSENFGIDSTTTWDYLNAGTGSLPVVTPNFEDGPFGDPTRKATRIQLNKGAGVGSGDYSLVRNSAGTPIFASANTPAVKSIWAKSNTGSSQVIALSHGVTTDLVTVGTTWQRLSTTSGLAGGVYFDISTHGNAATDQVVDISVIGAQAEEIAGLLNQGPSDYVSVGKGTDSELVVAQPVAADWTPLGSNTVTDEAEGIKVTYVNNAFGAEIALSSATFLTENFDNNQLYAFEFEAHVEPGNVVQVVMDPGTGSVTSTISTSAFRPYVIVARINDPTSCRIFFQNMGAGEAIYLKNISFKKIDHGSNVDGVKYFETTNPNYVGLLNRVSSYDNDISISINGNFTASDTSSAGGNAGWSWVSQPNSWEISAGKARHVGASIGVMFAVDSGGSTITAVAGHTYKLTYTIEDANILVVNLGGSTSDIFGVILPVAPGTYTRYVTAAAATTLIAFTSQAIPSIAKIDNVSVEGAWSIEENTLKGVLIEEASTNLQIYSKQFDNVTGWSTVLNGVVTADQLQSPDGVVDADQFAETAATGLHYLRSTAVTTTASSVYCASLYVKPRGNTQYLELRWSNTGGTSGAYAIFDIINGTITTSATALGTGTAVGASIIEIGNGYYRISIAGSHSGTSSATFIVGNTDGVTVGDSYAGNVNDGFYPWGGQLENLSYPTSFIPTVAASVTRNAEQLVYAWTAGNLDKGISMMAESYTLFDAVNSTGFPGQIAATQAAPIVYASLVFSSSNGNAYSLGRDGSTVLQGNQLPAILFGSRCINGMTINIEENPTRLKQYLNGVKKPVEYTNASFGTMLFFNSTTLIEIGASSDTIEDLNWPTKRFKIYAKALSQQQMEALTAL